MGFNPWPCHVKCILGQGSLYICVPLRPGVKLVATVVGAGNLQQTGILFRGVLILRAA